MSNRTSIYVAGASHKNPIPAAARVGNLLMSGLVSGPDPDTGQRPDYLADQCANMFANIRAIVEGGGGATDDIVKVTVYLANPADREALNEQWLAMFPDPHDRPARQAMPNPPNPDWLILCDFVAVIDG
jgi:2-iminobutanoate/2-iminopropanoate deaminase